MFKHREEKLYANFKKCSFCLDQVNFLGFVVGKNGVQVDERKVKVVVHRKRNKCTHNTKVTQDIQCDTQNLMISTAERMELYSFLLKLKI